VPKAKVAVTLDARTLRRVDRLVRDAQYRAGVRPRSGRCRTTDRLERRRLVGAQSSTLRQSAP
jgi:hypothetical protein